MSDCPLDHVRPNLTKDRPTPPLVGSVILCVPELEEGCRRFELQRLEELPALIHVPNAGVSGTVTAKPFSGLLDSVFSGPSP